MKKANFQYKSKTGRTLHGTVVKSTLGKVSISLLDQRSFSPAERYNAKQLANEIVSANFKHEAITHLTESGDLTGLIEILKKETETLKEQYLKLTEKYAKEYFGQMEIKAIQPMEEWYKQYDIETKEQIYAGGKIGLAPVKYDKVYYKMKNAIDTCKSIVKSGYPFFLEMELKHANLHYIQSIEKLAYRIEQKGLNQDKLKVETSHIGVNINTTLTDGDQTVYAWTIIARGPVQRPHYRYLVK